MTNIPYQGCIYWEVQRFRLDTLCKHGPPDNRASDIPPVCGLFGQFLDSLEDLGKQGSPFRYYSFLIDYITSICDQILSCMIPVFFSSQHITISLVTTHQQWLSTNNHLAQFLKDNGWNLSVQTVASLSSPITKSLTFQLIYPQYIWSLSIHCEYFQKLCLRKSSSLIVQLPSHIHELPLLQVLALDIEMWRYISSNEPIGSDHIMYICQCDFTVTSNRP